MNNHSKNTIKNDNKIENKSNEIELKDIKEKTKKVNKTTATKKNNHNLNKDKNITLSKSNIIIIAVSLTLFLILTVLVLTNNITFLDEFASNLTFNMRSDKLNNFMIILTNISSAYALIALSLLLLFILKNKREPFLIMLNLTSVFILSQIVKLLIHRPRPIGETLVDPIGYSYPSGHSMVSMAYFGLIAYIIFKNAKNKTVKYLSLISLSILIVAIGFSRVYLGVHYLSDVLGGFFLAVPYLIIFNFLIKKYLPGGKK